MIEVPMVNTLLTDYGSLTVPEDVASRLTGFGPHPPNPFDPDRDNRRRMAREYAEWMASPKAKAMLRWERTQCRLAGEAWAKGETHVITAEGLDDDQAQVA